MSEEELREAYLVTARVMQGWEPDTQPERDTNGRFEAGWIEWEFMIFAAGYQAAKRS